MKRALVALLWVASVGISLGSTAQEQALGAPDVPDVAGGGGLLEGAVTHRNPERSMAGLTVGLYSLSPQGRPSLRQGLTDENGRFRFEDISDSPQITYLVGVRVDDIPYGTRVHFEEGSSRAEVQIEVDDPLASLEPVTLQDSVVSFRWRGSELEIREAHRLQNRGNRVVKLSRESNPNSPAPLEIRLTDEASAISPGFGQIEEQFERRGNRLLFWGPIHPGENQVQFSYRVPSQSPRKKDAKGEPDSTLVYQPRILPTPEIFTALIPEADPEPEVKGLSGTGALTNEEVSYRSFRTEGEVSLDEIEITLRAPPESTNRELLEIAGVNVWLELDDSALDVKVDYNVQVDGTARLIGTPEAPLLTLQLPRQAELLGVAPLPELVGATLVSNGQIKIAGPLPAGRSPLRLHYRMPADPRGASIDLSFPQDIPLLNVLVADTGIRIDNERLHRRRPMRQGTRLFLHREAFQIEADESLSLRLSPVNHTNLPRLESRVAVLSVAALSIAFALLPLRRRDQSDSPAGETPETIDPTRNELEAIYASLRDLEHDFETGKLEETHRAELKEELELRAAQLMLSEENSKSPPVSHDGAACKSCSTPLQTDWQFCASCGAAI